MFHGFGVQGSDVTHDILAENKQLQNEKYTNSHPINAPQVLWKPKNLQFWYTTEV